MEKERMKRVVLNIHERQEEEDYQGCYWRLVILIATRELDDVYLHT